MTQSLDPKLPLFLGSPAQLLGSNNNFILLAQMSTGKQTGPLLEHTSLQNHHVIKK